VNGQLSHISNGIVDRFSSGDVNPIATADSIIVVAAGIRILFNISNARLRAVDSETEGAS